MSELNSIKRICKEFGLTSYYQHGDGMVGVKKHSFYYWFRRDTGGVYRKTATTRLLVAGARKMVQKK